MKLKKRSLTILLVLMFVNSFLFAQDFKIPPFSVMQANGKVFKAQDLPMGKPVIIIYFSPDCDHCEKMIKELIQRETSLKKASIALITYLDVVKVAKFVQQYNLTRYRNIYVGTEGSSFFVRKYYKIEKMPFIALHHKNGNLVKLYRNEGPLTDLINQLNKLK